MRFSRRAREGSGFTMIELMVVVVVVGILAIIAIPLYAKYVKNSRVSEATAKIGEIITAARVYAQDHQDATGAPIWPTSGSGLVDLTATQNFTYAITGSGSNPDARTTPLLVTARGIPSGKMDGVTVTVTVPDISSGGSAPVVTGL